MEPLGCAVQPVKKVPQLFLIKFQSSSNSGSYSSSLCQLEVRVKWACCYKSLPLSNAHDELGLPRKSIATKT